MKTSLAVLGAVFALVLASSARAATLYSYDALGRISVVTYDSGKQIVYSYDAAGNRSQVVTQTGTNQPPVAVPDTVSTNSSTAAVIHVLANDTDPDGDTLTIQAVSTASHGTTAITGSGTTVTYTPAANYSGPDSFGYTISDGHGHVASAPVTITVVNQPPVAVNDHPTVALGVPTPVAVLANDSDPEGSPLTVTAVTAPSRGTAVINSDSTITYKTIGGSNAGDSFVYTIADDHHNTAQATVTVVVTGSNHPPVANDDELDINETGVPVTPEGQLDPRVNDTDADGDPLTITAVTQGTKGTVAIIGGGTGVNYTYNTSVIHDLETTDSFTYTISDGNGGTSTATVTVIISVQTGA